jgi:manganese transport protein
MMATRAERVATGNVEAAENALRGFPRPFRILPFLGPAFVACVAYIDPGNFATNIAGGSKFGYTLCWVILVSNLMAMLIQTLSAKLGIATGRNLPEVCRDQFSRKTSRGLWVQAELIAMATDLAEFLGAALGFHLLFGMALFPAAVITGICTFVILGLQRLGLRTFEAVIAAFVGVLAVGILGATVMPHVIYLHSALTQNRVVPQNDAEAKRLYRYTRVDVVIAMSIAGVINMAMLVMAASVFYKSGITDVASLENAHETLKPILGGASATLFALALLASGLSSSTVGTLAGQVVMQGFIERKIPIFVRRLVTMVPALVVAAIGLNPTRVLVISQVVLSFGIPFALIPLVYFTSRKDLMGVLVNRRATTAIAVVVAALISALNIFLLGQVFLG